MCLIRLSPPFCKVASANKCCFQTAGVLMSPQGEREAPGTRGTASGLDVIPMRLANSIAMVFWMPLPSLPMSLVSKDLAPLATPITKPGDEELGFNVDEVVVLRMQFTIAFRMLFWC